MLLMPTEATAVSFSASSRLCEHDNSWTAPFCLMKFFTNMYLDILLNIKVIGQRSRSHCVFPVCMILLEPVGLDSRNVIH